MSPTTAGKSTPTFEGLTKFAGIDSEAQRQMSPEEIERDNLDFIAAGERLSEEGFKKEASADTSDFIRRRIRENGYTRNIIPPQNVTFSQMVRSRTDEMPFMIEDMEPDSR